MVRNDGIETRKNRLREIQKIVNAMLYEYKDQNYAPLKKTLAKIMWEGYTKPKAMEYLNVLVENEIFEIDETLDQIKRPAMV